MGISTGNKGKAAAKEKRPRPGEPANPRSNRTGRVDDVDVGVDVDLDVADVDAPVDDAAATVDDPEVSGSSALGSCVGAENCRCTRAGPTSRQRRGSFASCVKASSLVLDVSSFDDTPGGRRASSLMLRCFDVANAAADEE